jgi:hypothetical protein
VGRQVGVEKSTEGQAITPAAAEIGDVNILWGKEGKTILIPKLYNVTEYKGYCVQMGIYL